MGRLKLLVIAVFLFAASTYFWHPKTRQTVNLKLTRDGEPAAEVEVGLFIPTSLTGIGKPGECVGRQAKVLFADVFEQTRPDGTYRWEREFAASPGRRRSHGSNLREKAFALSLCANLDNEYLSLWSGTSEEPRRQLFLECDLGTRACQSRFGTHIDETIRPYVQYVAIGSFVLLMLFVRRLEKRGLGSNLLFGGIFANLLISLGAGWSHGHAVLSKALNVTSLALGGLLLMWLLGAWLASFGSRYASRA